MWYGNLNEINLVKDVIVVFICCDCDFMMMVMVLMVIGFGWCFGLDDC